jgi:glucan 1,3-beta-glucosidase
VLALQVALGLVFDPRYRDLPFAPLTAATVPFLLIGMRSAAAGRRPAAETLTAAMLVLATVYIVFNETIANWQAMWTCGTFAVLALILFRMRDARG